MAIANIQAQIANLTSQLSQHTERTTMQSVPTFGAPYMQGYPVNQQSWESVNTWGYQDHNQSRNNLFSNTYNSDWCDHSNSMWWEPQQAQQEAYWQPYEEFYSSTIQPPQPLPQQFQSNSGTSLGNAKILDLLTSLTQGLQIQAKLMENRTNTMGKLKNRLGEIVEFIGQIQEQSSMEVEDEPKKSESSQNVDEQLLLEEEEDDKAMASVEEALPHPTLAPPPLPQASKAPTPSNLGKVVLDSMLSDPIPPNGPIPCRFMQSKEEEGEKGIFQTLPKIQEKEVDGEYLAPIKKDVFRLTIKEGIGVDHKGHTTALKTPNLAEYAIPKTFEVVFVLEFVPEHTGKPPPRISISFSANILISMIQAPNLELKPLPDHFKYHLPFKDPFHAMGTYGA